MTPREIEVLLHYYCSPENYKRGGNFALWLIENYWIEIDPTNTYGNYRPTEKLVTYVEALQAVKEPIRKWIIPQSDQD